MRTIVAFALVVAVSGLVTGIVLQRRAVARPGFSRSTELYDVAFVDESHGWVAADQLYATTDGGASWVSQASAEASPSALAFADAKTGWGVGPAAVSTGIIATTDSGATWRAQHADERCDLEDVACIGARHAWAVGKTRKGDHPVIIATTDGGAHWTTQSTNDTDSFLSGVAFADTKHGWAVGNGLIYGTTDGGMTWRRQFSGIDWRDCLFADPEAVACADARHAWAVGEGDDGLVLATSDGGAHWDVQHQQPDCELVDVAFTDSRNGWAVGPDFDDGAVLMRTSDGGLHWSAQNTRLAGSPLALSFPDASCGYVVGNHFKIDVAEDRFVGSSVIGTTDGGANWKKCGGVEANR